MKNSFLILACFVLLVYRGQAQSFEGIIRWSMKTVITNPETKKKMEEGLKMMNSPEAQAQIKAMQEKMKDPEFKKQLDENPQMKQMMEQSLAQMEAAQKAQKDGGSGDVMSKMMPTGITMKLKNGNSLTIIEGGMSTMVGQILYLKDKDQTYSVRRNEKTYSVLASNTANRKDTTQYQVTKTSETAKIMGYDCVKYIVRAQNPNEKTTQFVWAAPKYKEFDAKALARTQMGRTGDMRYLEKIDGAPLRVDIHNPEADVTMELTEAKKQKLDAAEFTIPSDYKETKGFGGTGGMR